MYIVWAESYGARLGSVQLTTILDYFTEIIVKSGGDYIACGCYGRNRVFN